MRIEGYGGRAGNHQNANISVLDSLMASNWRSFYVADPELMPERNCANPKCGKLFNPRAEGDDYCSERCDPYNRI